MGDLDEVSVAIGELRGDVRQILAAISGLTRDVTSIKSSVDDICEDGCPRGKSNGHRISNVEKRLTEASNIPLQRKDWTVLTSVSGVISGAVVGLWKGIEWIVSSK